MEIEEEIKIIFPHSSGVGATSIINSFFDLKFDEKSETTPSLLLIIWS